MAYRNKTYIAFDGDNDTSDYEASLCGITFGANSVQVDG